MRTLIKSSFLWQFAVGFAIGAVGLVALQPAEAAHVLEHRFAPAVLSQR